MPLGSAAHAAGHNSKIQAWKEGYNAIPVLVTKTDWLSNYSYYCYYGDYSNYSQHSDYDYN